MRATAAAIWSTMPCIRRRIRWASSASSVAGPPPPPRRGRPASGRAAGSARPRWSASVASSGPTSTRACVGGVDVEEAWSSRRDSSPGLVADAGPRRPVGGIAVAYHRPRGGAPWTWVSTGRARWSVADRAGSAARSGPPSPARARGSPWSAVRRTGSTRRGRCGRCGRSRRRPVDRGRPGVGRRARGRGVRRPRCSCW